MTLFKKLQENYYRVCKTAPLCLEAASKFPDNEKFWITAASEEMGHDRIFKEELETLFGPDFMEGFEPSNKLVELINWVNQEEENHLVYKWFLEKMQATQPDNPVKSFLLSICPKFYGLHNELDKEHYVETEKMLAGKDIESKLQFILERL